MHQIEILLSRNRNFDKVRNIKLGGESFETVFEDIEAFSICGGVSNSPIPRAIYRKYFSGKSDEVDIVYAHQVAMKLKERYGIDFIRYCLALPPLPYKYGDVTQIFEEMDKAKGKLAQPIFRYISKEDQKFYKLNISSKDKPIEIEASFDNGNDWTLINKDIRHKFLLTFYTERKDGKVTFRDENKLVLKDVTKGEKIATIQRDGTITPFGDTILKVPTISLFLTFAENPAMMIINYGFQTGECSYCGRELSDPTSLKYGYGKKCAGNYDLKYG